MRAFAGIDLTSSPSKASSCAILYEDLSFEVERLWEDEEIISYIAFKKPILVGIDSPIGLPRGFCCLEEGCGCGEGSPKGRECERILMKRGIPSYFTTKKSIIKRMVYRAIKLRRELEGMGFEVHEVYPYAAKVILFGKRMPKKTTKEGTEFLRRRLEEKIPSLRECGKLNHDDLDALISAYTLYLFYRGMGEKVGDREEGEIVIPLTAEGFLLY